MNPLRALLVLAMCAGTGCHIYFGDDDNTGDDVLPADAMFEPPADAAVASQCLPESSRTADCKVDVSGTVVDFASGAPLAVPVTIALTTAWDSTPLFPPDSCAPLAVIEVPAGGAFFANDQRCDSPLHPPITLVEVVGAGDIAPTAIDYALTCDVGGDPADCGALSTLTLPVPSQSLALAWRGELVADGMPNAQNRGLVLLLFKELDGTPAAGVVPYLRQGTTDVPLVAGIDERFLAANRSTLVRSDALMTGVSGLVIVALPDDAQGYIGGRRGADSWAPVGVLAQDGWFFYEDRTITP